MPIEKNSEAITVKIPEATKQQIELLAKQENITASEFVRNLMYRCLAEKLCLYETLKEVFQDEKGNEVSLVSQVSSENRARLMRLGSPTVH